MNYSQLVELIQNYTEYTEETFVDNIPTFVRLAEERIYRFVKLPRLRKTASALATAPSTRTVSLPADFLAVDSLALLSGGSYAHLMVKEPDFIREAYPGSTTGTPVYYALQDHQTLVFGPTPDQAYTLELQYLYKPASIVDEGTSWLGDNAENALLYASLVEAYIFMKGEPDLIQTYERRLSEAVGQTKILGEGRERTDAWRNPEPRAPIT